MDDTLAHNDVGTIITGHISVSPDPDFLATKYERCVFGPVLPKLLETFKND